MTPPALPPDGRRTPRLRIVREFAADADRVWRLWTDPGQIIRWWAPPDAGLRLGRCDIRPGGLVEFVDDASRLQASWHVHEVDEPRRLVFTFIDPRLPDVHAVLTLEAAPERTTKAVLTMDVDTDEALDILTSIGFDEAMHLAMERAEGVLPTLRQP